MYGSHTPLVPLTGFGMVAGTTAIAGYPLVAIIFSLLTALLAGIIVVKSHAKNMRHHS